MCEDLGISGLGYRCFRFQGGFGLGLKIRMPSAVNFSEFCSISGLNPKP